MRKRFGLFTTLIVLAAALALPASTVAGSNKTWTVQKNSCSLYGGAYGYGQAKLKIRQDEYGWSGTAQFRVLSWLEEKHGNRWSDVFDWADSYSRYFGDDSDGWYYTQVRKYQFGSNATVYYHRIVMVVQWLDDSGYVIGQKRINGRSC